ncbi:glucan endo-1,3-beta-glucosidase-like [Beta vulgaris subsp. vulgaris]|uniref:glucan endo-1,3-beta-glucosidase-like n=1 Tax=Beta vulgaris subsp. vulgaris TaxID=3555 RepID=UPI00203761C7|nr:glucan endo-1,3-beta-glucosidase-like [Beta vulgaris subsp. vulgaris]
MHRNSPMAFPISVYISTIAFLLLSLHPTDATIGVCYGRKGNNLPCAQHVVNLYKSNQIGAMRLYDPDHPTLKALQGTNIKLMLGVRNEDIVCIASDQSAADDWVETNVVPYATSIKYIAVGNEIHPSDEQASSMEPAMQNILNALNANNLGSQIMVSTAVDMTLLKNTFPPSHSEFQNLSYITPIINFLTTNDWPLIVNIQPYTTYINDPKNISLDFLLFTSCGDVFTDDKTGKGYQNLFDALADAMYVAVEKVATSDQINLFQNIGRNQQRSKTQVKGEVSMASKGGFHSMVKSSVWQNSARYPTKGSECGQPKSGEAATVENAKTFYTNMIKHVKKGTPLTPGEEIEVYLFAMFDENQKPGNESERHYGLFTPGGKPKYGQLNFCGE